LLSEVSKAGAGAPVAIEATYGWYWAVDTLQEQGFEVHLAHPKGLASFQDRRVNMRGRLGQTDRRSRGRVATTPGCRGFDWPIGRCLVADADQRTIDRYTAQQFGDHIGPFVRRRCNEEARGALPGRDHSSETQKYGALLRSSRPRRDEREFVGPVVRCEVPRVCDCDSHRDRFVVVCTHLCMMPHASGSAIGSRCPVLAYARSLS